MAPGRAALTPAEQRHRVWRIIAEDTAQGLPASETNRKIDGFFEASCARPPASIKAWLAEVPREHWRSIPCSLLRALPRGTTLFHYFNRELIDLIAFHGLMPSTSVRTDLGLDLQGAHYTGLLWFTYTDFKPESLPNWLTASKIRLDRREWPARVVIDEAKLRCIYTSGGWDNAVTHAVTPAEWDALQIVEDGRWTDYAPQ